MKERLRQRLAARKKKSISDAGRVCCGVLVPLYEKDGEYHLLFTRRTDTVQHHKGQISFPGGKREACDADFRGTALREGLEEIGLDPGVVDVLGELDEEPTLTSNFVIHPFVVTIPYPYEFRLCREEVDTVVEVPLSVLLDKSNFSEGTVIEGGRSLPAYYYRCEGGVIWGATAKILRKFLELVRDD